MVGFKVKRIVLAAATVAAIVGAAGAQAKSHPDLSPLLGRWQLDPAETHMGRFGPNGKNIVRSDTFSFIFTRKHGHLMVNVYERYPQNKPTRTMAMIADGKQHACPDKTACLTLGGNAKDQTYMYRVMSDRFVMRVFYTKGQVSEYSTYAVSSDGQTFTMIAWSPETPFWQNIQVFKKQS